MTYRKPWTLTNRALMVLVIAAAGFFGWAIAFVASIKA